MVSIRYLREVGELRRRKSTPFRGLTWNRGSALCFGAKEIAPIEKKSDSRSLRVITSQPNLLPLHFVLPRRKLADRRLRLSLADAGNMRHGSIEGAIVLGKTLIGMIGIRISRAR